MQEDLRRVLWRVPVLTGAPAERVCEAPGCGRVTHYQKAFCSEHVELCDYAGEVLRKIAAREKADQGVAERGSSAASLEDMTCREILSLLELRGTLNVRRICRDLDLDHDVAWGYVTFLQIHRRVARHRSRETGVWRVELLVRVNEQLD